MAEITMDTTKQQQLEELFVTSAKTISKLLGDLSGASQQSSGYWRSPDADAFRTQWRSVHAPALEQVTAALKTAGANLASSREGLIRSQARQG